jgi:hypothetical protein
MLEAKRKYSVDRLGKIVLVLQDNRTYMETFPWVILDMHSSLLLKSKSTQHLSYNCVENTTISLNILKIRISDTNAICSSIRWARMQVTLADPFPIVASGLRCQQAKYLPMLIYHVISNDRTKKIKRYLLLYFLLHSWPIKINYGRRCLVIEKIYSKSVLYKVYEIILKVF